VQTDTFGDGPPLVWVMGWGNTVESRHERWFVDRLVDGGYEVHAVELPTNGTDFATEYVRPVSDYLDGLADPAVLAHSMGGLTVAHVQPDQPVVYLSPWWGMEGVPAIATVLFRIPTAYRILPFAIDPGELGDLATVVDATAPSRISPKWITTMAEAQESLPAIGRDDVVFDTPDDTVVSADAIETHTTPDQRRTYDGGHELFASEGREEDVENVFAALETE
jgi:pimeloyl-ACP methyl ester carboxylesterase